MPAGILLQGGELSGDGFPVGIQGDELLADAGAVGVGGLGGHAGGVVQFGDQVVLGGVDLPEPEPELGGLGVVPGLGVGGPGREQSGEPGGAAGGQRVGAMPVPQGGQQQVLAGGDGAGVVGDGGGVARVVGVELADVVGVAAVGVCSGPGTGAHRCGGWRGGCWVRRRRGCCRVRLRRPGQRLRSCGGREAIRSSGGPGSACLPAKCTAWPPKGFPARCPEPGGG